MNWFRQLISRQKLYGDLSEEIQEHLEEKIEELVAGGMSRKEAAGAARREFGNVTGVSLLVGLNQFEGDFPLADAGGFVLTATDTTPTSQPVS